MDPQNLQQTPAAVRPRTLVVDLARLIKENKLTNDDLKSLDKHLREEAIAYASILEDAVPTTLNIRKHALNKPGEPEKFGAENHLRPTPLKTGLETSKEAASIAQSASVEAGKPITPAISTEPIVQAPPPLPQPPKQPVKQAAPPKVRIPKPKPKAPDEPAPSKPHSVHTSHSQILSHASPHTPAHTSSAPSQPQQKAVNEDSIKATIHEINSKRIIIDKQISELMSEKNARVHAIEGLRKKEKEIEDEEARIRRDLAETLTSSEKKTLEEKRWSLEDERQALEKERWELLKAIDSLDQDISAKKKESNTLSLSEKQNKEALDKLQIKKRAEEARAALKIHEASYEKVLERKRAYEAEWTTLKNDSEDLINKISEKKVVKEEADKKFEEAEKKEKATTDEKKKHALEEDRWQADASLRETSKEVWATEEELDKKQEEIKALEINFASIQTEEEEILEKIAEAKIIIQKADSIK